MKSYNFAFQKGQQITEILNPYIHCTVIERSQDMDTGEGSYLLDYVGSTDYVKLSASDVDRAYRPSDEGDIADAERQEHGDEDKRNDDFDQNGYPNYRPDHI